MTDQKDCFKANKKYLNQYLITNEKIALLEARFYDLFNVKNKSDEQQEIINDTLLRLDKLLKTAADQRLKIYDCIDSLDDVRHMKIIEMFFIFDKSFSEIAETMTYSERHINRLYREAVVSVVINEAT